MKFITKLTVAAITATFMFGAINVTWGNSYSNANNALAVDSNQFGVWLDVNDAMAFGWEGTDANNTLKVGFAGPGGMQVRLGYDTTAAGDVGTTLGMARTWWTSTGDGWGTSLSTAIDFNMTNGSGGTTAGVDTVASQTNIYNFPSGYIGGTAYLNFLAWSNGGYGDVYVCKSSNTDDDVFTTRLSTYSPVAKNNGTNDNDAIRVDAVASGYTTMTKLR